MKITNDNIEKPKKKFNILAIILSVLFLVIAIISIISSNSIRRIISDFFLNKEALMIPKATVIDYSIKGACRIAVVNDEIIVCDENGITGLDKGGKWKWNEKASFINPAISVKGDYMLITDIGGTSIYLYKNLKKVCEENFPLGIISSNLGENGNITVVHNDESHQVGVSLIKPEGDKKIHFTRKFGDTYVIASNISNDGSQVITSAINMGENESNTSVSFLRTSDGEVFSCEVFEKEIFSLTWYLPDNTVFLSSGESLRKVKKLSTSSNTFDVNDIVWKKDNSNLIVSCGAIVMKKNLVLAFYPDLSSSVSIGGNSTIKIFDTEGKEKESFSFEGKATGIVSLKDKIAVFSKNKVALYNVSGKILGEYASASDIVDVSFLSDKEIYISTNDKIVYIEFLHKTS